MALSKSGQSQGIWSKPFSLWLLTWIWIGLMAGVTLSASGQISPNVSKRIQTARSMMLDYRLVDAAILLDASEVSPEEAGLIWYQKGVIPLLEVLLTDQDESYDAFFTHSDASLVILERQPNTAWFNWLRAEVTIQRAWVWAKHGELVRAALAFNGAFQLLELARKQDPGLAETQKGLGLVHVAVGAMPGRYRKLLSMLGLSGTLDQGLDELEHAAASSEWSSLESIVFLATIDKYGIPSRRKAVDAYRDLWVEHGPSPLIALLYSDALIRNRNPKQALEVVDEALQFIERRSLAPITYLTFYKAEAHFRMRQCEEAVSGFEEYDRRQSGRSLKITAYYMAGLCEELEGNRIEAEKWFNKITFSRGFTEEKANIRAAKRMLSAPISERERAIMHAVHLYDTGQDSLAIHAFRTVLDSRTMTPDEKVQAQFGLALALEQTDEIEEALVLYRQVVLATSDPLGKWKPYALLYSAQIYRDQGDFAKAEEYFNEVIAIEVEYDYKSSIQNQARLFRDQMLERLK